VARLGDEDIILDPYSDAPVPVRGILVEYRDRGNVDPRLDGYYLCTCRSKPLSVLQPGMLRKMDNIAGGFGRCAKFGAFVQIFVYRSQLALVI
jgi:hypothetical protein